MSYISKFKTDTAYSNTDINSVIHAITGEGILPSSPNDIFANLSDSGVTISDERCTVSWADEDKTQIRIGAGTVIMPDGSHIVIAEEVLPVSSKEKHYIYIYQDLILHNTPVCDTALPENESLYVLLATAENGIITDMRTLAKSKIAGYGTNPYISTTLRYSPTSEIVYPGTPFTTFKIGSGYSKMIIYGSGLYYWGLLDLEKCVFDISHTYPDTKSASGKTELETLTRCGKISFKFVDGVLYFYSDSNVYSISQTYIDFNLIIF